jgi:hypothetical protein
LFTSLLAFPPLIERPEINSQELRTIHLQGIMH